MRPTLVGFLLAAAPLVHAIDRVPAQAARQQSRPPNIVFILADDLGWRELGSYGNAFNETPSLDRLAAGGLRFTRSYAAAPVCTPTRAALMTGQHPARTGLTNYLDAKDDHFLSPDYVTLNEHLKKAGYVSGLIGKWHLTGDYTRARGEPRLHGWDEVICSETKYIANGDYFHPYFFIPEVAALEEGEYLTDRLTTEAVGFIERHRERPFFLYLSHYAPHTTLAGKPEIVRKYTGKSGAGTKQNNPELAAMLESIDEGVGRIVRALDDLGLGQNTIVVFASDNGGEAKVTSNAPLRAGKSTLYEGGLRVPTIVRWPAVIEPGTTNDTPITTTDFFPTFLDVAGVKPDAKTPIDGLSLSPLFTGKGRLNRRTLYWHYPLATSHFLGGRSAGALRDGDLKLIEARPSCTTWGATRGSSRTWHRRCPAKWPNCAPGSLRGAKALALI